MPYADNQGVKIHYETAGTGPVLIMQHGYTTSLDRWHEFGYVDALKNNYRLILIDARGHGKSDKPHQAEDYAWQHRTDDVLAVADELGLEQFSFWGYSMGGAYGYYLARFAPERLKRLIIGGADPYATSFSAFDGIDGSDEAAFVEAMENLLNEKFSRESCERMLNNDLRAMVAAAGDREALDERVNQLDIPCLLYVGDQDDRFDRVKRFSESLPSATFATIAGENHAGTNARSDLVLPVVKQFLSDTDGQA